jgi:hypothetical protein
MNTNKTWVNMQNALRAFVADVASHFDLDDMAHELRDRGLESHTFAELVDQPNCDLDFELFERPIRQHKTEKPLSVKRMMESAAYAADSAVEALSETVDCQRCSREIAYNGREWRAFRSYKLYVKAVVAFCKSKRRCPKPAPQANMRCEYPLGHKGGCGIL